MSYSGKCDDDDEDADSRSDIESEELSEADLEALKRELTDEISELEWEFKQVKETLYAERISQIENKLQQLKSSEAPELRRISALVDEAYFIRRQVAKSRRDLELEVANKEFDNALKMTTCDAEESLRLTEERIRIGLQESICSLQIKQALTTRHTRLAKIAKSKAKTFSFDANRPVNKDPLKSLNYGSLSDQSVIAYPTSNKCGLETDDFVDDYLPGQDLEPRKKPVPLSPSLPRLIYELDEEDIRADLKTIMDAVKEQKVAIAMSQRSSIKRES